MKPNRLLFFPRPSIIAIISKPYEGLKPKIPFTPYALRHYCNYFKALWGIETCFAGRPLRVYPIAIISKPYEGLKLTIASSALPFEPTTIAIISKPYEGLKRWSMFLHPQNGTDNCNYFKALWGIETISSQSRSDRPSIAIISKPYEGLKPECWTVAGGKSAILQLFQSLMRDWNEPVSVRIAQSPILQLFQSLMRDWNWCCECETRSPKKIAIISKPYEGLKRLIWGWSWLGIDCNYFKALWGIETRALMGDSFLWTIAIISKPYEGLKRNGITTNPPSQVYCNYFKALWGIETWPLVEWQGYYHRNCNYFKALWGIET